MNLCARNYIAIFFVCIFLFPFLTSAQLPNLSSDDTEGTLAVFPSSPRPHEEMTASASNYSSSFFVSEIQWYINKERRTDLDDKREINFIAGEAGETTTIEARLINVDGNVINLERSVTPIYVDLVIEPDTYVPHFYQGRPLPTSGSDVRATVIVDFGNGVREDAFAYKWTLGKINTLGGGILPGQSSMIFTVPMRYEGIEVEIYTKDGYLVGTASADLPRIKPELLFYERNSLYGLQTKAFTDQVYLTSNSMTIEGAPYYISNDTLLGNPDIEWKLNYEKVNSSSFSPLTLTVDRIQSSGNSPASLTVSDPDNIFQMTHKKINIRY